MQLHNKIGWLNDDNNYNNSITGVLTAAVTPNTNHNKAIMVVIMIDANQRCDIIGMVYWFN